MLDTGAIDRADAGRRRARQSRSLRDGLRADEPHGQYFKEQVRRELVERFGWQRVYQGGLRVFSTIDMPMQQAAEAAVADGLKALDERREALAARGAPARAKRRRSRAPSRATPLQAALVALDPATGHVRAMVGGRDFDESSLQPRRAGPAAAGLGVQAVRLRRRARSRLHAGDDDRQPRRADRDAAGRVDAGRRALDSARR